MSIKTWKAEFTQSTIISAAKKGQLAAAEHSLRRWIGFRKENLEKHGLEWFDDSILDESVSIREFEITTTNCALCQWAQDNPDDNSDTHFCSPCPLYRVREKVMCGESTEAEAEVSDNGSPIGIYDYDGDPEPMIDWLGKAVIEAGGSND